MAMDHHDLITTPTDPRTGRPHPLLVAVKGHDLLAPELKVAHRMAHLFGAPLLFVHVTGDRVPLHHLPQRLGMAPAALSGVTLIPETGDPAERILSHAVQRRCGLIILGAPRTLTTEAADFAVAERVLEAAPCPVMFAPATLAADWGSAGRILVPVAGEAG